MSVRGCTLESPHKHRACFIVNKITNLLLWWQFWLHKLEKLESMFTFYEMLEVVFFIWSCILLHSPYCFVQKCFVRHLCKGLAIFQNYPDNLLCAVCVKLWTELRKENLSFSPPNPIIKFNSRYKVFAQQAVCYARVIFVLFLLIRRVFHVWMGGKRLIFRIAIEIASDLFVWTALLILWGVKALL